MADQNISPAAHGDMVLNWSCVLTARDILGGLKPNSRNNKTTAEFYIPNYVARQFGLLQHVPWPYLSKVPLLGRNNLSAEEVKTLATFNLEKLNSFQWALFNPSAGETSAFANWWPSAKAKMFQDSLSKYSMRLFSLIDSSADDEDDEDEDEPITVPPLKVVRPEAVRRTRASTTMKSE